MRPLAITIIFIISLEGAAFTQAASFQQRLTGDYALYDAMAGEGDKVALLLSDALITAPALYLISDYEPGSQIQNAQLISPLSGSVFWRIKAEAVWPNDKTIIARINRSQGSCGSASILYFDTQTSQGWELCFLFIDVGSEAAFTADPGSNSYLFMGNDPTTFPHLYFYKIGPDGQAIHRKQFRGFSSNVEELKPQEAVYLEGTATLALAGQLGNSRSFALQVDSSGQILHRKAFEGVLLDKIIAGGDGGYFVLGSTALYSSSSGNERDLALMKLDGQFNILWAKVFFAGHFNYHRADLKLLPDRSLALAYSTHGAYPVILTNLGPEGEILRERGYPLYEPRIKAFSDGSLLLATQSHFDEEGNRFLQVTIAKTDTSGGISGCETALACLKTAAIEIAAAPLEVEGSWEAPGFTRWDLMVRDTTLASQGFCDTPAPPSPLFNLPDTICLGGCLRLEGLPNRFAHGIEWELSGAGLDSVWQDSAAFNFCFTRPGEYQAKQTVWTLGCAYSHTEQVFVLDSLQAWVETEEGAACRPPPLAMEAKASRPAIQFAWSNGSSLPKSAALGSGAYSVTVSDGYCSATAGIEILFAEDRVNPDSALLLPADTSVCEQHLPFVLAPRSPYVEAFKLDGKTGQSFELRQAGEYALSADIQGCTYEKAFVLETRDCLSKLYIPGAFSPNGDGINDVFRPQGKDIELLELAIFSRWGGMVYRAAGPAAGWDGASASGKELPGGIYAFKITYRNTLLDKSEEAWGEVSLVR